MKRIFAFLLTSAWLSFAGSSNAAIFNVTRFDDPAPPLVPPFCDAGDCSLREAVLAANVSGDPASEIHLPPGTYTLTQTGADEDMGFTGDLDILSHDLNILGSGADVTTIDASALGDRIFQVPPGEAGNDIDVVLKGLNLTGGDPSAATDNDGGAIAFSGNIGIDSLMLEEVVVRDNDAENGGGLAAIGDLIVSASTFASNRSSQAGGGINFTGVLKMSNSTVSGNTASGTGGGMNVGLANFISRSNTIYDNESLSNGGGLHISFATLDVANTILSGNMAGGQSDCGGGGFLTFTSEGYNIFGDIAACTMSPAATDQSISNPADLKLGMLGNYGGPTPTHSLAKDSPAIEGGNPADCLDADGAALTMDQRGQDREADSNNDGTALCDVGAFELGLSNLTLVKSSDMERAEVGDQLIYTLVVGNEGPNENFNVALTDNLPSNVSFVSAVVDNPEDSCSQAAGIVTCSLGQMDGGDRETVTIVVMVEADTASGTMTNEAMVVGTEFDPDAAEASLNTNLSSGGCTLSQSTQKTPGMLGALLIGAIGALSFLRTRPGRKTPIL